MARLVAAESQACAVVTFDPDGRPPRASENRGSGSSGVGKCPSEMRGSLSAARRRSLVLMAVATDVFMGIAPRIILFLGYSGSLPAALSLLT